jgi:hypothetical protein
MLASRHDTCKATSLNCLFGGLFTMQATSINLLTREGGLCATFNPPLTAEQYEVLLTAVKHDGETIAEMSELLRKLARSWDCTVVIDPC